MISGTDPTTDYETRTSDDKVQCRLCLEYNLINYNASRNFGWMELSSFKNSHQTSALHIKSVQQKAQEVAAAQLQDTPSSLLELNNVAMHPSSIPAPTLSTAKDEMKEMWDEFQGNFEMDETPEDKHQNARAMFERKLDEHIQWIGIEQVPDDTEMGGIADEWDENDNSDILTELLQNIGMLQTSLELCRQLIIDCRFR